MYRWNEFVNGISEHQSAESSFANINKDVPKKLINFLEDIIHDSKKPKQSIRDQYHARISSIAHSLVTACRPRSFFSPLLLAVGVTLHRVFGSKKNEKCFLFVRYLLLIQRSSTLWSFCCIQKRISHNFGSVPYRAFFSYNCIYV